jgi:hypothetical protein
VLTDDGDDFSEHLRSLAQIGRDMAFLPLAPFPERHYGGPSGKPTSAEEMAEMNGFEITELGQIQQQENMLERAQSQALRQTRRDAADENAAGSSPAWLVTFLAMKRRPSPARPCTDGATR